MSGRPKHTKRDKNHLEIVRQCRELGIVTWDLADCGGKIPDLLCIWRGRCVPVEVKFPGKENELTQGERDGKEECGHNGVDWVIATDLDDVLIEFGLID